MLRGFRGRDAMSGAPGRLPRRVDAAKSSVLAPGAPVVDVPGKLLTPFGRPEDFRHVVPEDVADTIREHFEWRRFEVFLQSGHKFHGVDDGSETQQLLMPYPQPRRGRTSGPA